jgi:hypothetical protein
VQQLKADLMELARRQYETGVVGAGCVQVLRATFPEEHANAAALLIGGALRSADVTGFIDVLPLCIESMSFAQKAQVVHKLLGAWYLDAAQSFRAARSASAVAESVIGGPWSVVSLDEHLALRYLEVGGRADLDLDKAVECFAQAMRLLPEQRPRVLHALLCRTGDLFPHFNDDASTQRIHDMIAVLSLQADPESLAHVPGTTRLATDNPTNPEWQTGGEHFTYPDWLAARRTLLQQVLPTVTHGRMTHPVAAALGAHANWTHLAEIAGGYTGPAVQPSDWPRLREALEYSRLAAQ